MSEAHREVIVLRDVQPGVAPRLADGDSVRLDVHDTCRRIEAGDYGTYGDLVKGCFIATKLAGAIDFHSYEYVPTDTISTGYSQVFILQLHGTVKAADETLRLLLELRPLVVAENDDDEPRQEELWEEIQGLAADLQREPWESPDCPLPLLYRATYIEQLLYWLQSGDNDDDACREITDEILRLEPSLADDPDFRELAGEYMD